MPVYKNEDKGTWYCSFYYTDWQGNRKRRKKKVLNYSVKLKNMKKIL